MDPENWSNCSDLVSTSDLFKADVGPDDNEQRSCKEKDSLLVGKINELEGKLRQNEIEKQLLKTKEEEHVKLIERLRNQVTQYRDEVIELQAKVETISLTSGINDNPLPSAVRQLETKVRELYKQKQEQDSLHEIEIRRIVEDCEGKTQRAVTLAASNNLLKVQLSEIQGKMKTLNAELSTCRKKMEQDLLEKELLEIEMAEIKGDDKHCFSRDDLNQVLDGVSTLQKDFHSTKQSLINDLETFNQEMFSLTYEVQQNFQQKFDKFKESNNTDFKLKEDECRKLQEEVSSLQSAFNNEKESHKSIVSELKSEILSLQLSKNENERLLEEKMRKLEDEIEKLKLDNTELISQLIMKEEDLKSKEMTQHILLKNTIDSLKERIENIQEAKMAAEAQIEEIDNQKLETERKLLLSEGRMKRYEEDMEKIQGVKNELENKLKDVKVEADAFRERESEIESELQKKVHLIKSLEQQIQSSQEEICILQRSISRLNSELLEANDQIGNLNLKITVHEAEKSSIHQEMVSIQKSNKSLLTSIVELQRTNSILEVEKRSLEQSLCDVSDTKVTLGLENIELSKQQVADKDELQQIQSTNKQLSSKIEELDKNLSELELTCIKLKTEKEELSQETSTLNDAINKLRRALSEVQIQRGKLSQSIAKAAQEKGELVQVRMHLTSETARLQSNLQSTSNELHACKSENMKLELMNKKLDQKVVQSQKEMEALTQSNKSLREQKQQLIVEHSVHMQQKEQLLHQLQFKHSQEMERIASEYKMKEFELQKLLSDEKSQHSKDLRCLRGQQEEGILAKEQEFNQNREKMKLEMIALKEKFESEIANLVHEKEVTMKNLEKQHEILLQRNIDQKMELEQRINNLELAKQDAENNVYKYKRELESREKSIDILGKELNSNGEQLLALQEMLDQVKSKAQNHLDDLQADLLEATTAVSQVEHKHQDAQVTIKHLEQSRIHYQEMLEGAQSTIDQLEQDNDKLIVEKRNLERNLKEVSSQLKREKEVITSLENSRSKAEAEKNAAVAKCGETCKSLLFAEESLTKLSSEHRLLQTSLTDAQKEASDLKIQLCSCRAKNLKMERQVEEKEVGISELKDKLVIATLAHESKVEEIESLRNILNCVKQEKEKLQLSLVHMEEISANQNQESSSTIAFLRKSQQEMKLQKVELITTISKYEVNLEMEKKNFEKLQEECDALKHGKISTDLELKQTIEMYRSVCAAYKQLAAVLIGCFNDNFEEEIEIESIAKQDTNKAKNVPLENGLATPDQHDIALRPPLVTVSCTIKLKVLSIPKVVQAIRGLQSTTFELRNSNAKMAEEICLLQEQIKSSKSQQNLFGNEIVELKESLQSLQSAYQAILTVKTEMDETIVSKNNQIKVMEGQLESLKKQLDRQKNELEVSNLDIQANVVRISAFAQELTEKEVEMTKAVGRFKQAELALQECEKQNADLKKSLNSLEYQMQMKEKGMKQLVERIQSLKTSQEISEKKVRAIQSEAKGLESSLKSSIEANCSLELELQNYADKCTKVEKECTDLAAKLSAANENLKIAQNQEKYLIKQVEKEEEKVRKFALELEDVQNSEKIKREVGDGLLKGIQREKQKIEKSLQETKVRNMQIEEELKLALQHGQVAQDAHYAKQCQQSKQLASIMTKNAELLSHISGLEKKILQQQELHKQELQAHSQETKVIKAEMEFLKTRWHREEDELKSSVEQQEKKISLLESKLLHTKQSKDKFIKRVKQQDTAITHFHSMLSDSLSSISNKSKHQKKTCLGRYGSTGDDDQYYSD